MNKTNWLTRVGNQKGWRLHLHVYFMATFLVISYKYYRNFVRINFS